MKKSTNESVPSPAAEASPSTYKIPVLWEMFTTEGGLSLLIIFPLVVLFFLKKAYESV
jgi:fumarate reductase subunit D